MKQKLITSRKWHNPDIRTYMTGEEVGSEIDLADFITAVVEEIGNPTMLVTKAALKNKLEIAAQAVIHEMKAATAHVV